MHVAFNDEIYNFRELRSGLESGRSKIEALVRFHESGEANVGLQLWTILTFEVWLRQMAQWSRPLQPLQAAVS